MCSFWKLAKLSKNGRRKRVHGVWVVAGRSFSKWFEYDAQADNYVKGRDCRPRRGRLRHGDRPTQVDGPPATVSWFEVATRYVDMKWPHIAAKSRTSIADALATVTPALATTTRGMPDAKVLRGVLYSWAFHTANRPNTKLADPQAAALSWMRRHSLSVSALDEPDRRSVLIRRALDAWR